MVRFTIMPVQHFRSTALPWHLQKHDRPLLINRWGERVFKDGCNQSELPPVRDMLSPPHLDKKIICQAY